MSVPPPRAHTCLLLNQLPFLVASTEEAIENVSGIPLAVTRTGVQTVVDARLDYG